ncbi:MAG TPA: hypothetical protein VG076_00770 [Acidimicrobiales bacterium]|nr:hypothetical protein [Acidimicrobiales bacterium]
MIALHALAFIAGLALVGLVLFSAVVTVVLPRGESVALTRVIFIGWRIVFVFFAKRARTWRTEDRIMSFFAPIALLTLPFAWLVLVLLGYTAMFWALGGVALRGAFIEAGSLFTFAFQTPPGIPQTILSYSEAALGLGLVALLISYLPSLYSAFSRREQLVTLLETRAGNPPSVVQMLRRFFTIHGLDQLGPQFALWEQWFADVEETHTSNAALVNFRSPLPNRNWLTSAGAVLDSASFAASTLDQPREPRAELCIRAGYLCLRRIAHTFGIAFRMDPAPTDPISVTREEYDAVYDQLAAEGLPLRQDRAQAWRDFAGWRVNYDDVLVPLARLIRAPEAPWSSDRDMYPVPRVPIVRRRHPRARA